MVQRRVIAAALVFALASAVTGAAWAQSAASIAVSAAFARATPGGAKTGAVYLTVTNNGTVPDTLLSASTPVASMADLHTMAMTDGIMKMRPAGPMTLLPGQSVALKPAGNHVMLMGLTKPLKEGDSFPLTLKFEKAGTVTVTVPVAGLGATMPPIKGQ